jgi:hypothetical protein
VSLQVTVRTVLDSQAPPLPGVALEFEDEFGTVTSGVTDGSGVFNASVNFNTVIVRANLAGFDAHAEEVVISECGLTTATVFINPSINASGDARIVVNWGGCTSDLDSFLVTPWAAVVGWDNPNSVDPSSSGTINVTQITDFSVGPGVETQELYGVRSSSESCYEFQHYVKIESSCQSFAKSGAFVRVYDSTGLAHSLSVPDRLTGGYDDTPNCPDFETNIDACPATACDGSCAYDRYWYTFNIRVEGNDIVATPLDVVQRGLEPRPASSCP